MAIMTRWRMPPDSWCGYSSNRRAGAGMRTRPSASIAFAFSAAADALRSCARIASVIWSPTVNTGLRRGHRLLEDHGDARAADLPHLGHRQAQQVAAVEHHPPGGDAPRVRHQAHDGQRQDRLAAAAFADDAERAPLRHPQRNAVHRRDLARPRCGTRCGGPRSKAGLSWRARLPGNGCSPGYRCSARAGVNPLLRQPPASPAVTAPPEPTRPPPWMGRCT